MNMTLTKRDVKLLIILLGIVIFAVVYLTVYNPLMSKAETLQEQTTAEQPQLDQLKTYYANLNTYQSGIETAKDTVDSVMQKFPSDVRYEDLVMYATDMQDTLGLDITALDFNPVALLMQFQTMEQSGDGTTSMVDHSAYSTGEIISCDLSYDAMKNMIDYIANSSDRTTLNTLTVSYNAETGGLTATVDLSKYFITGDESYTPTPVPNVSIGKSDLFGTVSGSSSTKK